MSTKKFINWQKHDDLEKIAASLHSKYKCEIPIDIDYLVEMMGINISDISSLKKDFGLYGFLAKIKEEFIIFVEKGDFKSTNYYTNFTIAEELAHFILHKDYFKNVKTIDDAVDFFSNMISTQSEMMIELNAKYLAGAILLPRENLKKKATEIYEKHKNIFSEIIKKGNDGFCDTIIEAIASSLNDVYRVPDGSIAYRLRTTAVGSKKFLWDKHNEWN